MGAGLPQHRRGRRAPGNVGIIRTAEFKLREQNKAADLDANRIERFAPEQPGDAAIVENGVEVFDLEQQRVIGGNRCRGLEQGLFFRRAGIDGRWVGAILGRGRLASLDDAVAHDGRLDRIIRIAVLHDGALADARNGIQPVLLFRCLGRVVLGNWLGDAGCRIAVFEIGRSRAAAARQ